MKSHPSIITQFAVLERSLIQSESQNQSDQRCKDAEDQSNSQLHSLFVIFQHIPRVELISQLPIMALQLDDIVDLKFNETHQS
jgi:hypothetical protein